MDFQTLARKFEEAKDSAERLEAELKTARRAAEDAAKVESDKILYKFYQNLLNPPDSIQIKSGHFQGREFGDRENRRGLQPAT